MGLDDLGTSSAPDDSFEREKWAKEIEQRERELAIKEREVEVKEGELAVKQREARRWVATSPLVLAITAATVAAAANVVVAWHNAAAGRDLERSKAEHARIVSAIDGDTNIATAKLQFLIATKLISDQETRSDIMTYIQNTTVTDPSHTLTQAIASASSPATSPVPSAALVAPNTPAGAPVRVTIDSGWLSGGNDRTQVCNGVVEASRRRYQGRTLKLVESSEDNRKDFLGHVTYNYHCSVEVS